MGVDRTVSTPGPKSGEATHFIDDLRKIRESHLELVEVPFRLLLMPISVHMAINGQGRMDLTSYCEVWWWKSYINASRLPVV